MVAACGRQAGSRQAGCKGNQQPRIITAETWRFVFSSAARPRDAIPYAKAILTHRRALVEHHRDQRGCPPALPHSQLCAASARGPPSCLSMGDDANQAPLAFGPNRVCTGRTATTTTRSAARWIMPSPGREVRAHHFVGGLLSRCTLLYRHVQQGGRHGYVAGAAEGASDTEKTEDDSSPRTTLRSGGGTCSTSKRRRRSGVGCQCGRAVRCLRTTPRITLVGVRGDDGVGVQRRQAVPH